LPLAAGAAGGAAGWKMNFQSEYFCTPSKVRSRSLKPAVLKGVASDWL
jgi:hypothetical protein